MPPPEKQPPPSNPRLWLLVALTLFASAAFYLTLSSRSQAERPASPTKQSNSPQPQPAPAVPPRPEVPSTPHKRPLENSHIAGERILTFPSKKDMQAFLASLPEADFTLLASNETLKAIRLRANHPKSFESLNVSADYNYTLLIPSPVEPSLSGEDPPFAATALEFIRTPLDNTEAGKGVTIALLDTGIRNHTTFDKTTIERRELSVEAAAQDIPSHGTAVASLLSGQSGTGVAPAATLISIRVLDTDGIGDTFTLAEGIVEAVDAGANIVNMSLGAYGSNQALSNAVAYAESRGVVLVASAGNEAVNTLPYPAAYPTVIAVTAVDAKGHPTNFSNQNPSVDIAAPGVGVYAAWGDADWISFTGTSAAAPYVSGAIALLSSQLGIPASEAASRLLANASDSGLPGNDAQLGRGIVDVQRSLDASTRYTDLALSDIYLAAPPDENGQSPVYLTVQNRGTEPIPSASLDYTLPNGITQSVYLGSLEPGAVASYPLVLRAQELKTASGYAIEARAHAIGDALSQNNFRRAVLYPIP